MIDFTIFEADEGDLWSLLPVWHGTKLTANSTCVDVTMCSVEAIPEAGAQIPLVSGYAHVKCPLRAQNKTWTSGDLLSMYTQFLIWLNKPPRELKRKRQSDI